MAADAHPSERTLKQAERLLSAARELYAVRATATVGFFARDRHGRQLPLERVNDVRAVRWSVVGALLRTAYTEYEIETVVEHAPSGTALDVTGPRFAMVAIDLVEAKLVELFQSKLPTPAERPPLDARDNPVTKLLDKATPQARRFWVAVLISTLPEITRKERLNALASAALAAETQRQERRRARSEAGGR